MLEELASLYFLNLAVCTHSGAGANDAVEFFAVPA
jgi:hypothetical protein